MCPATLGVCMVGVVSAILSMAGRSRVPRLMAFGPMCVSSAAGAHQHTTTVLSFAEVSVVWRCCRPRGAVSTLRVVRSVPPLACLLCRFVWLLPVSCLGLCRPEDDKTVQDEPFAPQRPASAVLGSAIADGSAGGVFQETTPRVPPPFLAWSLDAGTRRGVFVMIVA